MKSVLTLILFVTLTGCVLPRNTGPFKSQLRLSLVTIGMSESEIANLLGRPDRVNPTTTAAGQSDQWIYSVGTLVQRFDGKMNAFRLGMQTELAEQQLPTYYLYFNNGTLEAVQGFRAQTADYRLPAVPPRERFGFRYVITSGGLIIGEVEKGGPADIGGLKPGDLILAMGSSNFVGLTVSQSVAREVADKLGALKVADFRVKGADGTVKMFRLEKTDF